MAVDISQVMCDVVDAIILFVPVVPVVVVAVVAVVMLQPTNKFFGVSAYVTTTTTGT